MSLYGWKDDVLSQIRKQLHSQIAMWVSCYQCYIIPFICKQKKNTQQYDGREMNGSISNLLLVNYHYDFCEFLFGFVKSIENTRKRTQFHGGCVKQRCQKQNHMHTKRKQNGLLVKLFEINTDSMRLPHCLFVVHEL